MKTHPLPTPLSANNMTPYGNGKAGIADSGLVARRGEVGGGESGSQEAARIFTVQWLPVRTLHENIKAW